MKQSTKIAIMTKRKLNKQQKSRIDQRQQSVGEDSSLQEGLVICHHGRKTILETQEAETLKCHQRQNIGSLVAGDRVLYQQEANEQGIIVKRLPRLTTLGRSNRAGEIKPVAANINRMIIVFASAPEPSSLLIDSYLVAAHHLGLTPMLLQNKCDIGQTDALCKLYRQLNYPLLKTSVKSELGLNELFNEIKQEVSVFVGQSGVGKSSLIKALLPHEAIETQTISHKSRLGRHTTSASFFYHFPKQRGAIIDSPGIREFSLDKLSSNEVIKGFKEFQPLLGECKYRNCTHLAEPDCAFKNAAECSPFKQQRLKNLRQLLQKHAL